MKKYLLATLVFFNCLPVFGGQIVATVNDDPISSYDVEARAKLLAVQRAQYLNNKRKAQYIREALDLIIDEKTKINEAKRQGFSVSEKEIDEAVSHLEKQNDLKPGEMSKMLGKNGVPIQVLRDQVKADLMWLQIVQKNRQSIGEITSAEIEKRKNELRAKLKEEEFFVFEIQVPTKEKAEECYNELRSGVAFDTVAKKYSTLPSKEAGGEVGWIKNNHYSKAVTAVLRNLNPGDLSAPLKTPKGYLLLLLQDKKQPILTDSISVWELAQMATPINAGIPFEKELDAMSSCDAFMKFANTHAIKESVKSGVVVPDQLPSELKDILKDQKFKTVIGPVRTQDADVFFMKCTETKKQVLPDNDTIKMQIESDKMEALSEKLLRSAKRFVVIERKEK